MLGAVRDGELGLVVGLYFLVMVWPVWRICNKAGYSGLISLIFFIPIVNFVAMFYFAFTEWPIERRLREQEFEL